MGGISADDPAAVEKLQKKLESLEPSPLIMKEVNAHYPKHGALDGGALLAPPPPRLPGGRRRHLSHVVL